LIVYCSAGILYSTLSDKDITKIGEAQVWQDRYYDAFKKAVEGGVLDPRLVLSISSIIIGVYRISVYV